MTTPGPAHVGAERPTSGPTETHGEVPVQGGVTLSPDDAATARQQRVAVYGICEDGGGKVLLVRAAPHLTVAGQWFLPGGGLDHGEDPTAGLRREFGEETGLEIELGPLLGLLSDVFTLPSGTSLHTIRIIYSVTGYSGVLRDEVGGSSDTARWVALDRAGELPLRPYVRRALTELRRGRAGRE